ncbi:MAG TPA: EAL domain-containing protein [Spongiibacteraceae bacterium]|nr:EAL domain-containing protein [Spongiibacteraceae bacterium]
MSIEPLQKLLAAPPTNRPLVLPASVVVGLAIPIAVLSLVFLSMDLSLLGFCSWVAAIAWLGFALRLAPAMATIAATTLGGVLLLSKLLGSNALAGRYEQVAFILSTLLAVGVGQLCAIRLRNRGQLRDAAERLHAYENIVEGLFSGSRDCIKLLAADGTVLSINAAGLGVVGATHPGQLIGQNWVLFWGREQQKKLNEAWQQALTSGSAEFTEACRTLTGEVRSWHNTLTTIYLRDSDRPYMLVFSRDITEALSAQQNLKDHVAQLKNLLNSVDDAFVSLDSQWNINFINPHAEKLLAKTNQNSFIGQNFWNVFPVVSGDAAAECVQRAMERQTIQRCEHFYAQRNAWFSITALPYPGGVSVFLRDISSLIFAQKQAAEENARLLVAQDIAGFGDWVFDYSQGLLKLSPRAVTLLKLGECLPHEHKKRVLEQLHPQDRMALVQAIINASASDNSLDLIVRMVLADGGERHIHWVGRLIVDQQGQPQRMLGAVQDVSVHLSAQEALENARQFVRGIIDALPQHIGVIDQLGDFVTVNRAWQQGWRGDFGTSPLANNFFAFSAAIEGEDRDASLAVTAGMQDIVAGRKDRFEMEYEFAAESGTENYVVHVTPLILPGEKPMIVFSHNEITVAKRAMREAAENASLLNELTEMAPDIFWVYDVSGQRFTYISPAFESIYKAPLAPILNSRDEMFKYLHPDDCELIVQALRDNTEGKNTGDIEFRIIDASGELHWLSNRIAAIRDQDQERVVRLVGTIRDITEYKNYEQRLYVAAMYDELTGLPNRKMLSQALQQHAAESAVKPFAAMIINVDRFKNINDTLGHQCGDELLMQVGERLREAVHERGYIARLGSDEFAILCAVGDIAALAKIIMASFGVAFHLQTEHAFLTASIGVAAFPGDTTDTSTLLRLADVAMQRAKMAGRNNYQLFSAGMTLPNRERLALENELRLALPQRQFELFYQGKFNLYNGDLVGAEALLRWHSPTRGLVSPADFIPLLEETGLILAVGEWILTQACEQARLWHARTGAWLPLAVNVSALQVVNREFGNAAIRILRDSGLPAGIIELELTESALMTDVAHGARLMQELKRAGFSIALDDFGTGYSSLSYLRKFKPNTLKVDRSFVADLSADNSDLEIVAGIIQLAKALKIEVIAEGIELVAQRRLLADMGCHFGQGFLFCKPLTAEQFERNMFALEALPVRQRSN